MPRSSAAGRLHAATSLLLATALSALGLAGCGSSATVAGCLDAKGYLVQQHGAVIEGSSPAGVNFTLTLYRSALLARRASTRLEAATSALLGVGVVDFAGNPPPSPTEAPGMLSHSNLATLNSCIAHP